LSAAQELAVEAAVMGIPPLDRNRCYLYSESGIGEGSNYQVTRTSYGLAYFDDRGNRHDLEEAIRSATIGVIANLAKSNAVSIELSI
jgi:hypothetical protein